jgi:hypothetical protein
MHFPEDLIASAKRNSKFSESKSLFAFDEPFVSYIQLFRRA